MPTFTSSVVSSGQTSSGLIVSSGEFLAISGGAVIGTTIQNGGFEQIYSGGVDSGAVVQSGGQQMVFGGGAVSGATIFGTQSVAGGQASGTIVSGGLEYVSAGGAAFGTVLEGGAEALVSERGTLTSATVNSGDTAVMLSGGTASSSS